MGSRHRRGDSGSASVEFALVLPAVVVLLGFLGMAVQFGLAMIRVQDAASAAARIAIADTDTRARETAWSIAGSEAEVRIVRDGEWIRVTVVGTGPWGIEAVASAVTHDQG